MKEYLTADTLFVTIQMLMQQSPSLLLVVEGEDDRLAMSPHCSNDLKMLAGTGGKSQLLRTAKIAQEQKVRGVRFMIDRDYDDYDPRSPVIPDNVLLSVNHDFFMDMIFNNPRMLRSVIEVNVASVRRQAPSMQATAEEIESQAVRIASYMAAVRITSLQLQLAMNFTRVSFGNLDWAELNDLAIDEIVSACLVEPGVACVEIVEESARIYGLVSPLQNPPIGDHDLFDALARVMRDLGVQVKSRALQKSLIVAIRESCAALSYVEWFEYIQRWCARNGKHGFTCSS